MKLQDVKPRSVLVRSLSRLGVIDICPRENKCVCDLISPNCISGFDFVYVKGSKGFMTQFQIGLDIERYYLVQKLFFVNVTRKLFDSHQFRGKISPNLS